MKHRVLFLCTGNSCRSQMATGWARHLYGDRWTVSSAGLRAKGLDPRAVQVMGEVGINISGQTSKTIEDLPPGMSYDLVITVCDHAREHCPVLPGSGDTIHRSFPDPPLLADQETDEEKALNHYRRVRDQIHVFLKGMSV